MLKYVILFHSEKFVIGTNRAGLVLEQNQSTNSPKIAYFISTAGSLALKYLSAGGSFQELE